MAYYDLRIADKSEDMKEAKLFSIMKWIMQADSTCNIQLFKQYISTERNLE